MNEVTSLEKLKMFLPKLKHKSDALHFRFVDDDKLKLVKVFKQITPLYQSKVKHEKETASKFNIFKILRYGHYETRLHTPFLCHLLNPKGNHQLGSLFFNKFIQSILPELKTREIKKLEIKEELAIDKKPVEELTGRIDIYISFQVEGNKYCIAIENKINATDQPNQLKRYLDYLNDKNRLGENRVVYLTKYGTYPDVKAYTNRNEYAKIINGKNYVTLSHKYQIKEILESILKESIPSRTRETLQQYRQLLNQL